MSLGGGPKAEPPAWARVRLTRGRSRQQVWDVDSGTEPAMLIVGSGSRTDWRIHAPGVVGAHLELLWDGSRLWLHPLEGACSVDGAPLSDWCQLAGRTRLELGDAVLIAEASESAAVSTSILVGATLRPGIRASETDENPTAAAATRVAAIAASLRPVAPDGPTFLDEGQVGHAEPPSGAEEEGPTKRLRGGCRPGPGATGPSDRTARARTPPWDSGGPAASERRVDLPGTVRRGGSAESADVGSSGPAAAREAPGEPSPDEDATAFRPPGAGLVEVGGPSPGPPTPPDPGEASRGRGGFARMLPPRTLALLGLAMAVIFVGVVVRPFREPSSGPGAKGGADATEDPPGRTDPEEASPSVSDGPRTMGDESDEDDEEELEAGVPAEQERAAVDHLFAGRRAKALEAYRDLAAAEPHQRAYREVQRILARQAAKPCEGDNPGEEGRCER
ncbi:MAG: FHA domain-containing protein [Myxococcota bacterium]